MSSATTKDGLSDDTLHNTVPSFTLLKIKYKIMIKTVKFGWSQSLTGLSILLKLQIIIGAVYLSMQEKIVSIHRNISTEVKLFTGRVVDVN